MDSEKNTLYKKAEIPKKEDYSNSQPTEEEKSINSIELKNKVETNICENGSVKLLETSKKSKKSQKNSLDNIKRTCSFFVSHKKRFCRGLVAEGNSLCGQHLVNNEDKSVSFNLKITI